MNVLVLPYRLIDRIPKKSKENNSRILDIDAMEVLDGNLQFAFTGEGSPAGGPCVQQSGSKVSFRDILIGNTSGMAPISRLSNETIMKASSIQPKDNQIVEYGPWMHVSCCNYRSRNLNYDGNNGHGNTIVPVAGSRYDALNIETLDELGSTDHAASHSAITITYDATIHIPQPSIRNTKLSVLKPSKEAGNKSLAVTQNSIKKGAQLGKKSDPRKPTSLTLGDWLPATSKKGYIASASNLVSEIVAIVNASSATVSVPMQWIANDAFEGVSIPAPHV
ncbi:hypothetical protein V6N13_142416 [Hibiscus sabdariffa]|uniref:Uncharacterized protein n=1 Tax=Hibiscus sabdariffa TaxID=183260 RepID=A0ABR2FE66_9ROSI